jgi:plasmid replication initiation protein
MDLKATQSNALIRANQDSLSLSEKRILLYLISLISPEDEDFKYYRVYVNEFEKLLRNNKSSTNQIFNCMNAIDKMEGKRIRIEIDDHITSTRLVLKSKYYVAHGYFDVLLDDELKPHLLNLKDHFTTIAIKQGLQLTSVNAVRLYEILKSWQSTGKMIVKVDKLKEMMGIQGKYKLFSQFKANCLKQIIAQINKFTDIKVAIKQEIKKGRTVDQLTFSIKSQKTKEEREKRIIETLNPPPQDEKQHTFHDKLEWLGIINPSNFNIPDSIWEQAIDQEDKNAPASHIITTAKSIFKKSLHNKVEQDKKTSQEKTITTNKKWFENQNFDSSKVTGSTNDAYVFIPGGTKSFLQADFKDVLKPFILEEVDKRKTPDRRVKKSLIRGSSDRRKTTRRKE